MQIKFPLILDGATGTELQKCGYKGDISAEQWVLENPDSILGIQSGYENSHYFCRIFQQEHHCTPGTYRAENRKYFDKYNDQSE